MGCRRGARSAIGGRSVIGVQGTMRRSSRVSGSGTERDGMRCCGWSGRRAGRGGSASWVPSKASRDGGVAARRRVLRVSRSAVPLRRRSALVRLGARAGRPLPRRKAVSRETNWPGTPEEKTRTKLESCVVEELPRGGVYGSHRSSASRGEPRRPREPWASGGYDSRLARVGRSLKEGHATTKRRTGGGTRAACAAGSPVPKRP